VTGVHVFVRLGAESYALSVDHVLEVVDGGGISPLPGAGPHVMGVRNLRGQVVPVFDLARLLGAERTGPPERICVASHAAGVGGLAVDEVVDVADLPDDGEDSDAALLARTALVDGRLVGVVDMEALFEQLERRGGT
jgi:purine-binding chemotaxis protein CheW